MIDITLSVDGSYDHTGFNASHSCSFAVDVYTGRPVDAIMTEKCIKCDKCDIYADNGNCPNAQCAQTSILWKVLFRDASIT